MALSALAALFLVTLSSCNSMAKKVYTCDEDPRVSIEFDKNGEAYVFWNVQLKTKPQPIPAPADPAYDAAKKIQVASGIYRVHGKILTVTIGAVNAQITDITGRVGPATTAELLKDPNHGKIKDTSLTTKAVYTFSITNDKGKITLNDTGRPWTKSK